MRILNTKFVSYALSSIFELVKRYQNVPLIEKVLTLQEANNVEQASSDVIF